MAGGILVNQLKIACRERRTLKLQLMWREAEIYGYVMAVGEKLALFAEIMDFIPNGFVIFRLDQLEALATESVFVESMVRSEGLYEQFGAIPQVRLESWRDALEGLMQQEAFVALETVDDGHYYPGKLEKLTSRTIYCRTFGTDGEWEDKPRHLRLTELGAVRLRQPYLETYIKYIQPTPDDFMQLD